MVLTNAIYFKASWASPFLKVNTRTEKFNLNSRDTVNASFMHKTEFSMYLENDQMGSTYDVTEVPEPQPGPGMPGYRGSRDHRYGGDLY